MVKASGFTERATQSLDVRQAALVWEWADKKKLFSILASIVS